MASSGILRRVALVRTDVSEEISASRIMMTRTGGKDTEEPFVRPRALPALLTIPKDTEKPFVRPRALPALC
jgi:hypothetical protein